MNSREDASVQSLYSLGNGQDGFGAGEETVHILVGHHGATGIGYGLPAGRQGGCLPCLVDDPWNPFVGGAVVDGGVEGNLELRDIGGRVDSQVVCDGGEDDGGAEEEKSEDGQTDIDGSALVHRRGQVLLRSPLPSY